MGLLPQSELLASSAGNMFIQLLVVAFLAIFNTIGVQSSPLQPYDDSDGAQSMEKRAKPGRFDSMSGYTFGKRNFDDIDRARFSAFAKRNFDEIDRARFSAFVKRNYDEIDRAGFGAFNRYF